MIGHLSGLLVYRAADHVMIDVRGVGYLVYCSDRTLSALPPVGAPAALFTELLVREDLLQLFGFMSLQEKEWHRLLTGVQGVGAKAALAIQGVLGAEGLSRAIAIGDWGAVAKAKGVGPKIAQRVVSELKDKAPSIMALAVAPSPAAPQASDENTVIEPPSPITPPATMQVATGAAQADALSALTNLGYGASEAASAVAEAAGQAPEATPEALIRAALKLLAPKD
ncbi:MAG: Holliday junction branch migration protein RuvA [Pseudomonadota bacterium]